MPGSAVVVGVGPGLGASLARKFASEGYPVALIARSKDKLVEFKNNLVEKGCKSECYAADSTNEQQVLDTITQIQKDLGHPEVLCYNVGPNIGSKFPPPLVEDLSVDAFREGLEAGALGAFIWSKMVIPHMKSEGKGSILLTGATAALRGAARFSCLSPGKFALRSLSQTLSRELQPSGIHVAHVIVDGLIYSDRTKAMAPNMPKEEFLDPDAMAEEYWRLHTQDKSTWSQEIDLRPFSEKF